MEIPFQLGYDHGRFAVAQRSMMTCRREGGPIMQRMLAFSSLLLVVGVGVAGASECVDFTAQLRLESVLPLPAGAATDVAAGAGAAYVAIASSGVTIVDWSDPAVPVVVNHLAIPGGARDVALGDGALYVIGGAGELRVYDLAAPLAPAPVTTLTPFGAAVSMTVAAPRAYLVLEAGGLQSVDLYAPLAPVLGGHLTLTGGNREVAVVGDRAYLVGRAQAMAYYGVFYAVDVSDLAAPALVGSYEMESGIGWGGYYDDVSADEAGVYVDWFDTYFDFEQGYDYGNRKLIPFDVSDPAHPVPQENGGVIGATHGLQSIILGNLLAAVADERGPQDPWCPDCSWTRYTVQVKARDAAFGAPPLTALRLPAVPRQLTLVGAHLLVADDSAGLVVVDASVLQPGDPDPDPGTVPTPIVMGESAAVTTTGRYLAAVWNHVGNCRPGDPTFGTLSLYDLTLPFPQDALATYSEGPVNTLPLNLFFVDDRHLYVGNRIMSLAALPAFPQVGTVPGGGVTGRYAMAGPWLVATCDYGNVVSWDVSDPAAPVVVSTVSGVNLRWAIAATGNRVFVGCAVGIIIYDLDATGHLTQYGTLYSGEPQSLAVGADELLVGKSDGSLAIYDLGTLHLRGQIELRGSVNDIVVAVRTYVALGNMGWAVVDLGDGTDPTVIGRLDGIDATQVHLAPEALILTDDCPVQVRMTGRACVEPPVGLPDGPPVARGVVIDGVWPNPANPRVTVSFTLAHEGHLRVDVYDLVGRRVAGLADSQAAAGARRLDWDGRDDADRAVATGIYLLRLQLDDESVATKVMLAR
jgi:hypothetical protein